MGDADKNDVLKGERAIELLLLGPFRIALGLDILANGLRCNVLLEKEDRR
jgi:hypothetical protein